MMRVVHVVAGLEAGDGGPSFTLPRLWNRLRAGGVEVQAFTTISKSRDPAGHPELAGVKAFPRSFPGFWKFAPGLSGPLGRAVRESDLCHDHGCWLYPNWLAGRAARKNSRPLVISPLGHLDPWSLHRHALRKRISRALFEKRNWRHCSAFVAKSEVERMNLQRLGLGPVHVIPNGVDAAEWGTPVSTDEFFARFPDLRGRRLLLFLSRIHPKKGLPFLLGAWQNLCDRFCDWQLVVAGDMTHAYGQALRKSLESSQFAGRVTFTGALDYRLKRSAYEAASLFVLPSFSENFGQAILEALAAGRPVVTTTGCPWAGLRQRGCGWWVEPREAPLREALRQALDLSEDELRTMGILGREWVLRDYDWSAIAVRLRDLYRGILYP